MAQLVIRNLEDEARDSASGLGTEIAALFAGIGLDAEIPELRGHVIEPAMFVKRSSAKRTPSRR